MIVTTGGMVDQAFLSRRLCLKNDPIPLNPGKGWALVALLLCLLFSLFPAKSFGMPETVDVSTGLERYEVGRSMEYLKDPTGQFTVDDLAAGDSRARFIPLNASSINLGPYKDPAWFRFSLAGVGDREAKKPVSARSAKGEWLLYLGKNLDFYDEILVYWRLAGDGSEDSSAPWNTEIFGMANAVERGSRDPLCIRFNLPPDTKRPLEVYMRVSIESGFFIKPLLYTPEAWIQFAQNLSIFYGAYYGLAFSMIIYSLFHFFFLRDYVRLIFILYAVTLCAYFLVANELSLSLLTTTFLPATRKVAQFLLLLTILQMLWFTAVFLDAKRIMPWMYRLLQVVMIVTVGFLLAMPFFTYHELGRYLPDFGTFHVFAVMAAGLTAWFKGYRPARFFLLAWSFFLGGGLIYALNFKGVFPWAFLGNNAAQAGSGIEMVLLSLAIADRVKYLFEKLQRSQEQRRLQLSSLTDQLVQTEEAERRRIAGILHDSIGQTLVAIKWEVKRLVRERRQESSEDTAVLDYLDTCIEETRSLTAELYPRALYQHGLIFALESLGEDFNSRFGINVRVEAEQEPAMATEELKFILYRAVSELLNNVVKHARARNVTIAVAVENAEVNVSVEDDGGGFTYVEDPSGHGSGFGLFSIRERLHRIGGSLSQERGSSGGAKMVLRLMLVN